MECVVGAHCQLQPTNIVDVEWVGPDVCIYITYTKSY